MCRPLWVGRTILEMNKHGGKKRKKEKVAIAHSQRIEREREKKKRREKNQNSFLCATDGGEKGRGDQEDASRMRLAAMETLLSQAASVSRATLSSMPIATSTPVPRKNEKKKKKPK